MFSSPTSNSPKNVSLAHLKLPNIEEPHFQQPAPRGKLIVIGLGRFGFRGVPDQPLLWQSALPGGGGRRGKLIVGGVVQDFPWFGFLSNPFWLLQPTKTNAKSSLWEGGNDGVNR